MLKTFPDHQTIQFLINSCIVYSNEYHPHAYCFVKNLLSFCNINIIFFFINTDQQQFERYIHSMKFGY
jgi:hypothetical protein